MTAPRCFACSSSSRTTTPAPSPRTNPSLSLSNGLDAFIGSVEVESAVRLVNPATPVSQIHPSAPPASITSASPYWIARNASPMQFVPLAHAVTTFVHFPFSPSWMEILPAAMFEIIIGTSNGLTLPGPLVRIFSYSFSTA